MKSLTALIRTQVSYWGLGHIRYRPETRFLDSSLGGVTVAIISHARPNLNECGLFCAYCTHENFTAAVAQRYLPFQHYHQSHSSREYSILVLHMSICNGCTKGWTALNLQVSILSLTCPYCKDIHYPGIIVHWNEWPDSAISQHDHSHYMRYFPYMSVEW